MHSIIQPQTTISIQQFPFATVFFLIHIWLKQIHGNAVPRKKPNPIYISYFPALYHFYTLYLHSLLRSINFLSFHIFFFLFILIFSQQINFILFSELLFVALVRMCVFILFLLLQLLCLCLCLHCCCLVFE